MYESSKRYEPSRQIENFAVTSFQYHEGCLVIDQMHPGMVLDIVDEFDNPYDPNALALYFDGVRIGYVPRKCNFLPAQLVRFGHADTLEARIMRVAPDNHPSDQLYVGLFITDAR